MADIKIMSARRVRRHLANILLRTYHISWEQYHSCHKDVPESELCNRPPFILVFDAMSDYYGKPFQLLKLDVLIIIYIYIL